MSALSLSSDSLLRAVDKMLARIDSVYPPPLEYEADEEPIDFAPSEEVARRTCETQRPGRGT